MAHNHHPPDPGHDNGHPPAQDRARGHSHDHSRDSGHDHSHEPSHDHGHGHGHHHPAPDNFDLAFAIGAGLNLAFTLAEFGFGFQANSVALMADAVHNLGDVLTLLVGWGAAWLTRRPPTARRTYGWGRSSILAALVNAVVLLVSVGAIGIEAIQRLLAPRPIEIGIVMVVAACGILVNGGSALLFMRGRHGDLNIRAQFLHLAGDAAVSLGVVVAAGVIALTGWWWLDPAASLGVAAIILAGSWSVLRQSADLAMDAVPDQVPHADVQAWMAALPGVLEVHDLHIWGLSTTETALTAHLVFAGAHEDRRPHELATALQDRFGIGHATLQIESDADAALCRLRPNDVI